MLYDQLYDQKTLGEQFRARIVDESPIGRGLKKMAEMDKKVMLTRFNTAYYLAKSERPYSDAEDLITLHEMNGMSKSSKFRNERAIATITDSIGDKLKENILAELKTARYYSLLTDGSTDKGVIEQEALYLLFMSKEGKQVCSDSFLFSLACFSASSASLEIFKYFCLCLFLPARSSLSLMLSHEIQ